jgi:hypothetical protein
VKESKRRNVGALRSNVERRCLDGGDEDEIVVATTLKGERAQAEAQCVCVGLADLRTVSVSLLAFAGCAQASLRACVCVSALLRISKLRVEACVCVFPFSTRRQRPTPIQIAEQIHHF